MSMPATTDSTPTLSEWLYTLRTARGLSQEALALRAGISVPTYGRLERASLQGAKIRATLDTIICLVAALEPSGVEIRALLESLSIVPNEPSNLPLGVARQLG